MAFGAAAMAVGAPIRLTASGVVAGGTAMARTGPGSNAETTALPGCILGFFCNSTTSGTIALSNNNAGSAGSTNYTGTITPSAGNWYNLPILAPGGIYATIANTLDVTFIVVE